MWRTQAEQSALANETRAADEIEIAEAAIARSEAALKQAQADESYAIGNFHRIEPLLDKGFVTEDDVHKARTTADAKTAAVDQAKSQLQLAKASLLAASAQKQQATAQISQSRAQVKESAHSVLVLAPLLAQREQRAAAVRLARYNYEQCSVVAPFDARVTNLTTSEGQYVKVGEQLFTLIDNRTWWVLANFRESQIKRTAARNARRRVPNVRYNQEISWRCRERELWRHPRSRCSGKTVGGIAGYTAYAKLGASGLTIPSTYQDHRSAPGYASRRSGCNCQDATVPPRSLRFAMTTYGRSKSPVRDFIEMLRAELAWYPGRHCAGGKNRTRLYERDGARRCLSNSRRGIRRELPDIDFTRKSESHPENCISHRPSLFNRNC